MTSVTSVLSRWATPLAERAPARVFAISGLDAPGSLEDLRLRDEVALVDSPRSANLLVVAGILPEPLYEPAWRVHDQMSRPRRVIAWVADPDSAGEARRFPGAIVVGADADLVAVITRTHMELLRGSRVDRGGGASGAPILPDVEPAPWRGVGPYGQGGKGMTGGVPFGRPLPGRAPDRDGLELDQLTVRVGPFFPPFPSGLVLDIKLQGDVIQEVVVDESAGAKMHGPLDAEGDGCPFHSALSSPVAIAKLERARAAHHLRWLAHALRVLGLVALGRRALAMATTLERDQRSTSQVAAELRSLARLLNRARSFAWSTAGVGAIAAEQVAGRGLGPVARASGVAEDLRSEDQAYRALDFEPVVQRGTDAGDVRARWRQRLAEAEQSLALVERAGGARAGGAGAVEGPRGVVRTRTATNVIANVPSAPATEAGSEAARRELLPTLLAGSEWGDAVTTIVSLDLAPFGTNHGSRVPSPGGGE